MADGQSRSSPSTRRIVESIFAGGAALSPEQAKQLIDAQLLVALRCAKDK